MAAEYEMTINDYLQIIRRRFYLILVIIPLVLIAGLVAAFKIPPVYQAAGVIAIESQEIPVDLIQPTTTKLSADERIQLVKQHVLKRDNILQLVAKFNLYKKEREKLSPNEIFPLMLQNITVEPVNTEAKFQGKETTAFRLSFEDGSPELAYQVTNELVNLFLAENVRARKQRASETTGFLNEEAEKQKAELERVESQVAAYKQQHTNSLPEHQELHMNMIQRAEAELAEVEREYKSTQDELHFLDVELSGAKAGVGTGLPPPAPVNTESTTELEKLKAEYSKMSVSYTDDHPTMRALKRKIETLEKAAPSTTVNTKQSSTGISTPVDFLVAKVQAKIDSENARLKSLEQQKIALKNKIAQGEQQVIQIPQVEHGLSTLLRDYENAKKKYDEVRAKQANAMITENLEDQNKAERFSLLEAPTFPEKPVRPSRVKIMGMAVVAALGIAGAIVMLLEMLDRRLRGIEVLTAVIKSRPLAVIPYITTQHDLRRKKNLSKYFIIGGTLFVLASLALTAAFTPLGAAVMKMLAKLQ